MTDFTLNAQARTDLGKGASRRLRHSLSIPAVVYGGDKEAQSLTIVSKELNEEENPRGMVPVNRLPEPPKNSSSDQPTFPEAGTGPEKEFSEKSMYRKVRV